MSFLRKLEKASAAEVDDDSWKAREEEWKTERENCFQNLLDNDIWNEPVVCCKNKNESITKNQKSRVKLPPISKSVAQFSEKVTKETLGNWRYEQKSTYAQKRRQSVVERHEAAKRLEARRWTQPTAMGRGQLKNYLKVWDRAAPSVRRRMLGEFILAYSSRNPNDTDHIFAQGASLLFCRFSIGFLMSFFRRESVWMYFDALSIFMNSLQSGKFVKEFVSMGAVRYAFDAVRSDGSCHKDRIHVLKFLIKLISGGNSLPAKMFICHHPAYLASLIDYLTSCTDRDIMRYARSLFDNLCVGNKMANVATVCKLLMGTLSMTFNSMIQAMGFFVMKTIVLINYDVGKLCFKHVINTLHTSDQGLLIELQDLSLIITKTPEAPQFLRLLLQAANGGKKLPSEYQDRLQEDSRCARTSVRIVKTAEEFGLWEFSDENLKNENEEHKSKQEIIATQHGALSVMIFLIRNEFELAESFTRNGVFGLTLKTLGLSPHMKIQRQATHLVIIFNKVSPVCALSYKLLLPKKMMELIINSPEECLQHFTPQICSLLKNLGELLISKWSSWMDKVVKPIMQLPISGHGPAFQKLESEIRLVKKAMEISRSIELLLETPSAQAQLLLARVVPRDSEAWAFEGSSDSDFEAQGQKLVLKESDLEEFENYFSKVIISEESSDELYDIEAEEYKDKFLGEHHVREDELNATELAMLQEAQKLSSQATMEPEEEDEIASQSQSQFSQVDNGSEQRDSESNQGYITL